jgi:ribosomal protein L37E
MKSFIKRKEDFLCENCGEKVRGNGYTNHCPKCFFSKHVDINPGDRACDCGGLMEPIAILQKNGEFSILHRCVKCGFERKNKISDEDDRDELYKLMKKLTLSNLLGS